MRKTKIICTLGPAVDSVEALEGLIEHGMDAARFNFSHGTHESHLAMLEKLKQAEQETGACIPTILDTKGPEIRITTFRNGESPLKQGDTFTLTTEPGWGEDRKISVTYNRLHEEIRPGAHILLDDGLIDLQVREIRGRDILCTVVTGGVLSNNKSINLPDTNIALPALTERDLEDLAFGAEHGFDFVAASFVRSASDVNNIRKALEKVGGGDIRIIAKIENREGVRNMREILEVSDGVMVARGDLGVEVPAREVPVLQKKIISIAADMGKAAVTATQMLDSMIHNPRPTRAEVSDVANAVYDGTGAVMLSGETASGRYPIDAVRVMSDIVSYTEEHLDYWSKLRTDIPDGDTSVGLATTHACVTMAKDLDAKAIVVATETGRSARMIARFRPECPILALTASEKVRRHLMLNWGTTAYLTKKAASTDQIFAAAAEQVVKAGFAKKNDIVVFTAGIPTGRSGSTNLVKAQVIE